MKFFSKTKKKKKKLTLTMKLWTESVWDWRWSQEQRKKNAVAKNGAKNRGRSTLEPRTLGLIKMVKLESLKLES